MLLKLKRTPGIFLVGFMGCGKSTVGRALAEELGWRFLDLDTSIEKDQGCTIAHIFDTQGEAAFRLLETAALRNVIREIERGRPHVVSLGGGAFVQDANFTLIDDRGVTLWLDCPFEMVQRRIAGLKDRPLARDPEKFRELYETRRTGYARADYRIEVHGDDSAETVRQIQSLGII